jgi:hypothetical protein
MIRQRKHQRIRRHRRPYPTELREQPREQRRRRRHLLIRRHRTSIIAAGASAARLDVLAAARALHVAVHRDRRRQRTAPRAGLHGARAQLSSS